MRAALICLALAAASVARAGSNPELDEANQAFRSGQLAVARQKYNDLLYPPPPRIASKDDLVQAYVNLGVCRVDGGDPEGAKREFEKALGLDPNKQLDPVLVTNKEAIRLFDDTKADLRNRERDAAAKQALAQATAEREALMKSLVFYESHQFYLNFVPPLGQFQNDDNVKGILFGSGELATFATSVGIWAYLADKYGINNQHLNVDRQTAQNIRTLQEIEVGSGVAFFGLYIWASIDAYRHYKPQVRKAVDEKLLREQLPPELRDLDLPKANKTPPKSSSLHLVPMITPSGAGIGVGWEN